MQEKTNMIPKEHSFDKAKQKIKRFSEQLPQSTKFEMVNEEKTWGELLFGGFLFGEGFGPNHKVTGEEMNKLIVKLQDEFTSINNTNIKLIKEFGEVYNALEALDKEYILGILTNISATEKVSNKVKENEKDLIGVIDIQEKTLKMIKKDNLRGDNARFNRIDKKLKSIYWLAGSSLALTIINAVLILLRVI